MAKPTNPGSKKRPHFTLRMDACSPLPIFRQMAEQLARQIVAQRLTAGMRLPDICTLANTAGVSLKTAERALNELIRKDLCFRRPKNGTLVGKPARAAPAKPVCGLFHPRGLTSFERDLVQAAIQRGLMDGAERSQIQMAFVTGDPAATIGSYRAQAGSNFKGLIMLRWESLDQGRALAEQFPDLRFVYVNYELPEFDATPGNILGVFNDDFAGACQMGAYLASRGHRQIAALSLDLPDVNYGRRIAGLRQALQEAGWDLPADRLMTGQRTGRQDLRAIGRTLAAIVLRRTPRPTALFCVNDLLAAGAVDYLRSAGLARRVEVTGYDRLIPDLWQQGGFSTVAVDFEQMGRKALKLLQAKSSPKVLRVMPHLFFHRRAGREKNPQVYSQAPC